MAKNLNLDNFSRPYISKLQFFLKNRSHSNWSLYLVLTSGQKRKKSLEPFLRKISKCLILGTFLRISPNEDFFQKSDSVTFLPLWSPNFMQKIRKILRAVSGKTALPTNQPTNQPKITNNTNLIGPRWHQDLTRPHRNVFTMSLDLKVLVAEGDAENLCYL